MGKLQNHFIRWRPVLLISLSFFLLGLLLRLPLINPSSLWMDDARAALVAKSTNFREFIVTTSHVPILLSLITWVSGALIRDKEIGPQLFPFLVSCVSVPCFFRVAKKISGSLSVGLLCGFLLAFNPQSAYYASQIKPYPGDILAGILALFFMSRLVSRQERFPLGAWIVFCLLAPLVSSASLIIIAAFYLNGLFWIFTKLPLFGSRQEGPRRGLPVIFPSKDGKARSFCLSGLIFLVFLVFYYRLILRGQMSPALKLFWQEQAAFMPVEDLLTSLHFLSEKVPSILRNALDLNPLILIFLLVPSVVIFFKDRDKRYLVSFYAFLYLIAIFLSAMKMYPLSGERTDSYFLPFNILFMSSGFPAVRRYLPRSLLAILLVLSPFVLYIHFKRAHLTYLNEYEMKPLVNILERNYRKGDAIVCWSHANWGLGYYTDWKIRFVPNKQFTAGFVSLLDRPDFYLLDDDFYDRGKNIARLENVGMQYDRTWFIAGFYDINAELYGKVFLKNGFRLRRNFKTKGAFLKLYERPDPYP